MRLPSWMLPLPRVCGLLFALGTLEAFAGGGIVSWLTWRLFVQQDDFWHRNALFLGLRLSVLGVWTCVLGLLIAFVLQRRRHPDDQR